MSASACHSIAVLGGCGHVGLPLALSFASRGQDVTVVDIDAQAVAAVNRGEVGFREEGAESVLAEHLGKNLRATCDAAAVRACDAVIVVVGTSIDEHLNPRIDDLLHAIEALSPHLHAGQLLVLRSTVYPGATLKVHRWLEARCPGVDLAFAPERVAQGFALREIASLPQIVAGATPRAYERAAALFSIVADRIVPLDPAEAELAKLLCNAWRYISFAVANQFYALCADNGIDYYRIHHAVTLDYPRMKELPGAGFAAGPCLFKDTMQLAAYCNNEFSLGQSAMLVNEGLPRLLMKQLRPLGLADKTVGLLGVAFKGDSDDVRDSLAFKMKKLLEFEAREVLCTDELVVRDGLLPLEEVLARADVLVIGAPHTRYRTLSPSQPTLDPWNLLGRGGLIK